MPNSTRARPSPPSSIDPAGGPTDIRGASSPSICPRTLRASRTSSSRTWGRWRLIGTNQLADAAPNGETLGFFTLDIIAQILSGNPPAMGSSMPNPTGFCDGHHIPVDLTPHSWPPRGVGRSLISLFGPADARRRRQQADRAAGDGRIGLRALPALLGGRCQRLKRRTGGHHIGYAFEFTEAKGDRGWNSSHFCHRHRRVCHARCRQAPSGSAGRLHRTAV